MKKIISIFVIGLFALFFISVVFAEEETSQHYFCLAAKHGTGGHNASLSIDTAKYTPIPGEVFVIVRINSKLTTGNITLDDQIFGNHTGYDELKASVGFGAHGNTGVTTANPVADPSGFPVEWHDDLDPDKGSDHFWFGMQVRPAAQNVDNQGAGALQNGTFDWAVSESNKDCNSIRWDPLGYVFDAQTLGIIPGAIVTIFDATKTPPVKVPVGVTKGTVASNPYITLSNGKFSFFTEAGTYSLTVEGTYNGKILVIADPSAVNPTYKTAGYTNLYVPGSSIVEAEGQTVRTDILVQTVGAPAPILPPPSLTDVNMIGSGEQVQVSGVVLNYTPESPNAQVVVVYENPTTLQTQEGTLQVNLDVNGRFKFNTAQALVSDTTYLISRLDLKILSPVTQNGTLFNRLTSKIASILNSFFTVHAASSVSIAIDPIPSYLEGVAKDGSGTIIPSALVGIYLKGSTKAVYQTKADINGHYVIGSQFIPPLPYEIKLFKVTGEVIKLSTKEYLKQNATYLKTNNINPFSMVKATTKLNNMTNTLEVTKTVVPQNNTNQNSNVNSSNSVTKGKSNTSSSNPQTDVQQKTVGAGLGAGMQGIVMVIVVIMVLLMIGVGAFIMMKSKQQTSQY